MAESHLTPAIEQPVVLVGMPGSGKSTVGMTLARLRQGAFSDSDALVEQQAGMSVAEIFKTSGEAAFRQLEQGVIRQWLTEHADSCNVLACGGGVMPKTLHATKKGFTSVFLDTPASVLVDRLWSEKSARPLLAHSQTTDELEVTVSLLSFARFPQYLCADMLVFCGRNTPNQIAKQIIMLLHYVQHTHMA
jgi:shikimate kinase